MWLYSFNLHVFREETFWKANAFNHHSELKVKLCVLGKGYPWWMHLPGKDYLWKTEAKFLLN